MLFRSQDFGSMKKEIESLTSNLARESGKLSQAQWKLDQAQFDLDLANIDLKKAKSQVNSVGNYVNAANAAARSYEHASNLSDEVSRKIDAQAQGVKDITISQFVLQESSSTSVRWAVVGLILGVALTLIATRRNRKRDSDISRESSLPVRDRELEEIGRAHV